MTDELMKHPPLMVGLFRDAGSSDTRNEQWFLEECKETVESGFQFMVVSVSKDISAQSDGSLDIASYDALPHGPFTRKAHNSLSNAQWTGVIGAISNLPGKGLENTLVDYIINEAGQWAKYLGFYGIMVPLNAADGDGDNEYSVYSSGEIISRVLLESNYKGFDIWIRTSCRQEDWYKWNELRNCVGIVPGNRLHVVLDFADLTEEEADWAIQYQRWFGESIQAIIIPTSMFLTNEHGWPVLSRKVQKLVEEFLNYYPIRWIIEGPCLHEKGYSAYRNHIAFIDDRRPPPSFEDAFLRTTIDHLQLPLQPLYDQLASSTYEDFEKDSVKYDRYEAAIRQALIDRHSDGKPVTIMVLGCGRGPILNRAVCAARDFSGEVKLFAIEKNPSAVVTLQHRINDDWADQSVTLVKTDMREWDTDERADIIVSELLGSWGDNELSPECLDGAQHLLKETGISIPASYTSYLSPITTSRLHATVASIVPFIHGEIKSRKYFETTYVVRMGAVFRLADEQACFTFNHPNEGMSSNERFVSCTFEMPQELSHYMVHGFRGTFDCQLYGDYHISIADENNSKGMFGWSPLYIPVQNPFTVAGGTKIEVLLWRKVGPKKVWYEWMVKGHTHIHNIGGRSSSMGT
jgi:protein arginine N-methyltransferase 5